MLTTLFPRTHTQYSSLPVLGSVLEELCAWLQAGGFPPSAIRRRVVAAPFLDQFLRARQVRSLRECTPAHLRACLPREDRWTPQIAYALGRSLLDYLQERGELASRPATPSEQLVGAYRAYLERVRGLGPASALRHAVTVSAFLRFLKHGDRPQGLHDLHVAEIDGFVAHAGQRVGRITMQKVTAILRSFLKFLAAEGKAPTDLAAHVESPRQYRGERLVRALPWETVCSLLRAVDHSTLKGRRDYAMLLLIATYGLRVVEVASLDVDDVAWRARVIRVPRPKIGTPLVVPLTDEVATALVDYLRNRGPAPTHRRLFLRVRAPQGPIQSTGVCDAFDAWAVQAGLRFPALGGAHSLRHSLAMRLLRQDTPLKTIGDLLGHRSMESTGVYLRLHVEDLRDVALPLPAPVTPAVRS
ncbi:MAG: tyrosine-type recombinase/integrase [Planctomycetes bacterium]|nr:tyrosine-type recombinase/integrase [Planctomycetota bacterium]